MDTRRHARVEPAQRALRDISRTAACALSLLLALMAPPYSASRADLHMGAASAQTAIATLRIEPGDGDYLAWADNRLAGPIEVILRPGAGNTVPSDPPLPARASVEALGSTLVARLRPASGRSGSLRLSLQAVPGSSNARPRDIEYLPPLQGQARIDQGFGGSFSHDDEQNRHALDFAADIGTPVFAARAGTVMQVEAGFRASGLASGDARGRANFIRLLHDDGSMALYAHLSVDGVQVRIGQQIQAGQRIGLSGNTGFSTGPHLHFAVQVNRSMQLVSIPFRMRGVALAR